MKKIIAFALAALALGTQAAQLNWGSTGYLFDDTTQMRTNNGYTTKAYLVYLGSETDSNFGTLDQAFFDSLDDAAVATKTANALGGVVSTSGTNPIFTPGTTTIGDSEDKYTYGKSVFGIVYVSKNADKWGEDSYYFTTGPFTLQNSGSSYAAATETTTFSQSVPSGSKWTAVPEPSVALMGLLGIGMLIKRRRA